MNEQEAIKLLDNLDGMIEDNHGSDYDMAFNMAIKALEKQIPKKVVAGAWCKCPSCGELFASDWKFCFECGQKLDWTVEE